MSNEYEDDFDLAVEEGQTKIKPPPLYKVFMVNDDFTPMDFVVHVLKTFFDIDEEGATQIMLNIHTKGIGICGIFPKDIAETRVSQVNAYSRSNQHPLMCDMEEE